MTWLYLPSTCFPSAPASEASNSASLSPSHIAMKLAWASVTWRGKHQPPQVWSRRWKQGGFIRRLSGLTLPLSTADLGAASWISSLRAIRVRKTASPESAPGPMAPASSPPKSSASPMKAGLILSSVRTCQGTRTDSLKHSARHWKGWATALRQEYSARPKPKTPCSGNDSSSWPSAKVSRGGYEIDPKTGKKIETLEGAAVNWPGPTVSDTNGAGLHGEGAPDLRTTAAMWKAPKASDGEKGGPNQRGSRGDLALPAMAAQWAGPCAMNYKGSSEGSSEGSIIRKDGKSRADLLHYQAEQLFSHLPSSLDRPIAGGSTSSIAGPNSNQPSVKRRLNPIFVEALMRWPTGLSGFERPETAWTRWQQLMPSFLSMLCSSVAEPVQQLDLFGDAA